MEAEEEMLENFLRWATELGISDSSNLRTPLPVCLGHSLSISTFPDAGGRGLAAARDLRKGELILRVPKSAIFTAQTLLLKDRNLSLALKDHPSLSSTQILTICLLAEMNTGTNSWWRPYLVQLPRRYSLLVDNAVWTVEKAVQKTKLEWKEAVLLMQKLKFKPQFLTFRAWLWASATVSSRTLHVPWDDAGCLCPVGDLFNYAAPGEETCVSEDLGTQPYGPYASSLQAGCISENLDLEPFDAYGRRLIDAEYREGFAAYCFYARKNYRKGEQVLLSYGMYTNLELLEHYGFILNENPNDKVLIPLEPDIYASCSWPKELLYIHQNGKPSFAMLSALRLWATPPNKRRSVGHLAYSGSQLSAENEICIMNWIVDKCRIFLENLPTSIEEDYLLLCALNEMQDSCTSSELRRMLFTLKGELCGSLKADCLLNGEGGAELPISEKTQSTLDGWKLAVQWRHGYKRSLVDCISYCNEIISCLCGLIVSTMETK